MPGSKSMALSADVKQTINSQFAESFSAAEIQAVFSADVFPSCETVFCGYATLVDMLAAVAKMESEINIVIVYELVEKTHSDKTRNDQAQLVLSTRAIDPLAATVSFSNSVSTNYYEIDTADDGRKLSSGPFVIKQIKQIEHIAARISQQLTNQISNARKRYNYKLRLSGFTQDEINIFSGIALSAVDNVNTTLLSEKSTMHFLGVLLPTTEVTFELSTLLPPSQFREQMALLFKRMDVSVTSKFVQQENLFITRRMVSPYSSQLIALWLAVVLAFYFIILSCFWVWAEFKLNSYKSLNQASKWVVFVNRVAALPFPFLCLEKWKAQLPYWDKRMRQADIWFDNAHHLLQNQEIESANVFLKKSLEENASNISAQALESAIAEQLSNHQVIDDERQQWKSLVSRSVQLAQEGKLFESLKKAYIALELCQSVENVNRPVIDLQIDSMKSLIKRITANKGLKCDGVKFVSEGQEIVVNCGNIMHIGRRQQQEIKHPHLNISLPQDTLSRIGKSIALCRQENGFTVEDLGSTNGMWLQYVPCETHKEYILTDMDQLHLSPPDDIGSIGFQVRYIASNKSVALTLCQNAILSAANLHSSKSFINHSEYSHHRWYLSNENFFLVLSFDQYHWYSESEWLAIKGQDEANNDVDEVLKIELKEEVYLHLANRSHIVRIDGVRVVGPVPLPLKSKLSVNDYEINIELICSEQVDQSVSDIIHAKHD